MKQRNRDNRRPFDNRVGSAKSENTDTMPPIFSFEKMVDGCGYCVNSCDADNQAALAKRLFMLSKLTWLDIFQSGRHSVGTEKIARHSITAPLPNGISEDVTILALRYNGHRPMLGYRDGRVFYLLLIDHDFSCYDHG
jgi:hypothetical protein